MTFAKALRAAFVFLLDLAIAFGGLYRVLVARLLILAACIGGRAQRAMCARLACALVNGMPATETVAAYYSGTDAPSCEGLDVYLRAKLGTSAQSNVVTLIVSDGGASTISVVDLHAETEITDGKKLAFGNMELDQLPRRELLSAQNGS